jgi:hypothetical protein
VNQTNASHSLHRCEVNHGVRKVLDVATTPNKKTALDLPITPILMLGFVEIVSIFIDKADRRAKDWGD